MGDKFNFHQVTISHNHPRDPHFKGLIEVSALDTPQRE